MDKNWSDAIQLLKAISKPSIKIYPGIAKLIGPSGKKRWMQTSGGDVDIPTASDTFVKKPTSAEIRGEGSKFSFRHVTRQGPGFNSYIKKVKGRLSAYDQANAKGIVESYLVGIGRLRFPSRSEAEKAIKRKFDPITDAHISHPNHSDSEVEIHIRHASDKYFIYQGNFKNNKVSEVSFLYYGPLREWDLIQGRKIRQPT